MGARLAGLLVVAALTALTGCGSAPAPAGGGTSGSPSVTAVPVPAPSGPSTGLTAIQGSVTGLPPGQQATVHLEIWPTDDDTEVGEVVGRHATPDVTTDAAGRWSISLDPARLERKYFSEDTPYVNVDVSVRTSDRMAEWSTPLWFLAEDRVWRGDQHDTADDRVVDLTMDLAGQRITAVDSTGEDQTQELLVLPFTPPPG